MTRINTNVSSLVSRNTLGRSQASLQEALTRLSTGLRINTGKDDPAGLIASENLRSDITSIKKAISNTERANQVIATADSALGQVSSLLNDIRGLVTESANSGALSADQISANQLQIDSSLKALNRIAQTTTFQGRKLLDGSLDFITSSGTNFGQLSDLKIDQANLGASGTVAVDVTVSTAATQAQVDVSNIPAATTGANAASDLTVTNAVAQASGLLTTDSTNSAAFTITAKAGGAAAGAEGNGVKTLVIVDGASEGASYNATTNVLTATIDITGGADTVTHLAAIIGAGADFATSGVTNGTDTVTATNVGTSAALTGGRDAGSATIHITADTAGVGANGVTATLIEDSTLTGTNVVSAALNGGNIEVRVKGTVTKAAIASAIDGLAGYSATTSTSSGDGNYTQSTDTPPSAATLAGGVAATGGLATDVVFQLSGSSGSEVFSFGAGTGITDLVSAINSQSDATGVTATASGTTLQLKSSNYGSDQFVNLDVIQEGVGGTITAGLSGNTTARDAGTDVVATVNGITANGKGNELSINTATLDLSTSVAAGFTGTSSFTIAGGGALFQLGPDVVSNQQARIGIGSVNTARLGGVNGKLYQLGSGGSADLTNDPTTAALIVEDSINQITGLRGRLGAFQRTSLETNQNALNDTLINLTEAESNIRDADFAAESANLTRAQILVQSGTAVLQIANSNPQNVLSLLR
jgi:flagellin